METQKNDNTMSIIDWHVWQKWGTFINEEDEKNFINLLKENPSEVKEQVKRNARNNVAIALAYGKVRGFCNTANIDPESIAVSVLKAYREKAGIN